MKTFRLLIVAAVISLLAGCFNSYYEVKDPSTEKTYFTTKVKNNRDGSVSFSDGKTRANVTIQNSETVQIDKAAYKEGTQSK
jgi:hypothetical protein